uniref:Ig-like domain-containing protein n=1 Tax=Macrostomum lignano TaxID=282301 RepID=A0A1I8HIJ6_9PLAT
MLRNSFIFITAALLVLLTASDASFSNSNVELSHCGGISLRRQLSDVITWQSSAMHGTCLTSRRLQRLAQAGVVTNEDDDDYWFHTGYATNFSMDPYNWLVIQLRSPILLLGVRARFELRHFLNLAAGERDYLETRANIEVFVSPDKWDLGGEHCHASVRSTTSLPRSVADGKDGWELCTTRTLLLRKKIADNRHDRFMSFADLTLGQGLYAVIRGQPLHVECVNCLVDETDRPRKREIRPHQRLCLDASERMTAGQAGAADCVNQQVFVSSAEPQHAGTYQCQDSVNGFNATAKISVLYGPDQLKIDYSIRSIIIQDSPSESSGAQSRQVHKVQLELRFATSDAFPMPKHSCIARISDSVRPTSQRSITLTKSVSRHTSHRGALESAWLASLSPDSSDWVMNSSVMVRCTAMQTGDTKHGFYQGRFDLHRRIQLLRFDSATQSARSSKLDFTNHLAPVIVVCVAVPVLAAIFACFAISRAKKQQGARTKLHRITALGASDTAQTTTATSAGTQCSCFFHRLQQTSSAPCNAQQLPEHGTVDSGTYDEPLVYIN